MGKTQKNALDVVSISAGGQKGVMQGKIENGMQVSYHTPVAFATNVSERETPPNSAAPILSTKRAYAGLADYAQAHGLTAADLQRWQWQQATKAGRKALKFETKTGPRYRFLDGQSPTYIHETGYQRSWYGLTDDLIASIDDETPLVICNGEISTVTGQTYLVPAVCITSGEKSAIPQNLLDELTAAIPGAAILIALDCDQAGRRAAAGMMAQLKAAGFKALAVDLGLSDGGDLADFCMMHGAAAYERLKACAPLDIPESAAPVFTPRVVASVSKPANVSPDAEERAEKRRAAWFKKAFEGIVHTLETMARERNKGLFSSACKLFDLVHSYPQYSSESAAYDALYQASATNGYLAKDGQFAVNSAIKSAQRTPRQYVDMGFDPYDNPAPRLQNSAHADFSNVSPKGETGAPAALPDAIVMRGLSIWGLPIVSELNYILGAHARGLLPSIFTLEDVNQARLSEGIDSPTPLHVYVDMGKYGVLQKVTSQLKDGLHPIDLTNKEGCKSSFNSKRGRKAAAYALPSLADLIKAMFQPMALSLMAMHPDKMPLIDESLTPLMRAVLEGLLNWKKPFETVSLGLVRAFLNDADKYRAEAVYEAILALPITDASMLADMGLSAAEYAAYTAIVSAQGAAFAGLIALKNRLLLRLYETHKASLNNPTTTRIEGAPLIGEAWLNAFYRALLLPHDGRSLWNYQLNAIMGIDNKRSAKRAAARAGISSTPREDTRPFTVSIEGDCTPTWHAVKRAAKDAAKQGESGRAMHIRSYDERGRLLGSADVAEYEPDDFSIGVRFEVIVQLPNLITVSDAAPLADEMPETAAAPAAEQAEQTPAQDAQGEAKETASRGRRRITPARLHDRKWFLERLLAPFCQTDSGVWFNPLTGELHDDAEAVLTDAISLTALQGVS